MKTKWNKLINSRNKILIKELIKINLKPKAISSKNNLINIKLILKNNKMYLLMFKNHINLKHINQIINSKTF